MATYECPKVRELNQANKRAQRLEREFKDAKTYALGRETRIRELEGEVKELKRFRYHAPTPVVWVRESGETGGARYLWCDSKGQPVKDGLGNRMFACDAKSIADRLGKLGIDVEVRVYEEKKPKYCTECGKEKG